ncbi:hypothetical protein [Nocardia jiangxiensis]|uniref:Uncharacterized protein n=1 Tax=Nocardia jiangxiensis TaxID=282685 RepID=A0ABW6SF86_9NOCA|nr:hypothetical protein [Nocardia jiangxiensis]
MSLLPPAAADAGMHHGWPHWPTIPGWPHPDKDKDKDKDKEKNKNACDQGNTGIAYNALSFGATGCFTATRAFNGNSTNEFGRGVGLAGNARGLVSLDVVFASYGCSVSGNYVTGCVTTPGATFEHPITANIYSLGNLTTPIATVTQDFAIPYRPSADNERCTGDYAGAWFNAQGGPNLPGSVPEGGRCQFSVGKVLTFSFPAGTTLPDQVVWTVTFNTTEFGHHPIGGGAACYPNCPYDSLNVGATNFPNAPYAGTDLPPADTAYASTGRPAGPLGPISFAYRPLGAITTR